MPSEIFKDDLLAGQVALVSGGGSGLGRRSAIELTALGAQVVVCGRRSEPLDETVALCAAGSAGARVCDIREEGQVDALVDAVLADHGKIDLLVNNAGGQFLTPAEDITPKGFRTVIRLNVEGTWLMTHAVATKAMIPSGAGGKIVNVTISPHNGLPGMAHSSAARAAVENLTRVLSIEWSRYGIKLNSIAAGQFATETLRTKYPKVVVDHLSRRFPPAGSAPRRSSPGRSPTSPRPPETSTPARSSPWTGRATTGSAAGPRRRSPTPRQAALRAAPTASS